MTSTSQALAGNPRLPGNRSSRSTIYFGSYIFTPFGFWSALGFPKLIYRLGALFRFRVKQRVEVVAGRMLAAHGAGITSDRAPELARRMLANPKCRMLDDLILSWPGCAPKLRCGGIHGLEHLRARNHIRQERHRAHGPFFAPTAWPKRYLATRGYPMLTVRDRITVGDWWGRFGRRFPEPRRLRFLRSIAGEAIYVQDHAVALKILQRLRSGGLVFLLLDGRSGNKSAGWPFPGVPRNFQTGVFEIIRLSGCAVVPMLSLGRSSGFRIKFGPALEVVTASGREEFVRANLPNFVRILEKQIQEYSEE